MHKPSKFNRENIMENYNFIKCQLFSSAAADDYGDDKDCFRLY